MTTMVDLPGGRQLEVLVTGPDTGLPLVFHYGTPSAAVPYPPMVEAATRRGLRLVVCSRPGYGNSPAHPGRTVADVVPDVAAVLDALGADTFVTLGWSGGGPHALACAALLPDQCRAAASLAGVAPYAAKGLDWLAGMGSENVEEFGAAAEGQAALTRFLEGEAAGLATVQAAVIAESLGDLITEVDRRQLTGEFAEFLAATFRKAVGNGVAGWRDDDLAFLRDWGFPLPAEVPVSIWQGAQDRMVPYAHGEWLAANVPAARSRLRPAEGHLSIVVGAFEEILDDLLEAAG